MNNNIGKNQPKTEGKKYKLSIFRSNNYTYAYVLDFEGKIIASASDIRLDVKGSKTERAKKVGENLANKVIKLAIKTVVFDRRKYKYHGRIKALADGARSAGLVF
jgi:large subunit ribosomal protein L18